MKAKIARRSFLGICAGGTLGWAAGARAVDPITMKVAYATGTNYYHHVAAQDFKQALESSTDGQIKVELYPNGQLGGESQILEGLRAGTIEAYIGAGGVLSNFVPEVAINDLPFLWRDFNHAFGVLDGPVGEKIKAAAPPKGFRIVGFWPAGRRDVYGNVKIEKLADFKGVKIRTLQTPIYIATFKAWGALPTPLAWPETYGALQLGVIDASETALTAMIDAKQDEVTKFVSLTGHALTIATLTVGSRWYDGLPAPIQQAIAEANKKARARAITEDQASFQTALDRLKAVGKTILTPDIASLSAVVRQTVYPQFADRFDPKIIKDITG